MQKLVGESMHVPTREGREITLVDLVTHSAGLPRMPNNFKPKDVANPYADYTVEQLNEFISGYKLKRVPERKRIQQLGNGAVGTRAGDTGRHDL